MKPVVVAKLLQEALCDSWNFSSAQTVILKPENHWSCIAHLSAEDMLKSAVIEEVKNIKSE